MFDSRASEEQEEAPEDKPWSHGLMATLADISLMIGVQNEEDLDGSSLTTEDHLNFEDEEEQKPEEENKPNTALVNNASAMDKISALEDELQRLREQIALLVTVPQNQGYTPIPSTPSTPAGAPAPPPPPPPPPPPTLATPVKPVAQIIREVRAYL